MQLTQISRENSVVVPLLVLSISLLLLCRPCLCVLFCCFSGPDLCGRELSSNAILFIATRVLRMKPLTSLFLDHDGGLDGGGVGEGALMDLFVVGQTDVLPSIYFFKQSTLC